MLTIKEAGGGVNKDLLPSELAPGVWSDSSNIRFRNGFAQRRLGTQAVFTTPAVTPYYIQTYSTSTARFVVECGTAKVYVDDGSTQTDITPASDFAGARDDRWTGGDLNGVLVLTNGVDDPKYWGGDPANNLATLTGWTAGTKADSLRPFKYYLVAVSVTKTAVKYPYRLMWSNAAEPGAIPTEWTASATNDASEQDLTGIGRLVDSLPLGDVNIVYGQEGRYAMQYVGGNDVFRFTRMSGRDGLLNRGCVVDTPKGHVFLTNGDVMLHNGGEAVSIAEGVIRSWLFSAIDSSNAGRTFLTLNPQQTEVWIVFPSTGQSDCDTVAAWSWKDNTWGIFSVASVTYGTSGLVASTLVGGTWASDSDSWDSDVTSWDQNEYSSSEARLLLSTSTPRIGLANTGSTDFGTAISWYLEKTGISLDDPDSLKVLSRSRPHMDAVSGTSVTVKHAATMNPDDAPVYNSSSTFTVGTSTWANQFAQAGRYLAYRLEGSGSQSISLRSYDLELTDSKARF